MASLARIQLVVSMLFLPLALGFIPFYWTSEAAIKPPRISAAHLVDRIRPLLAVPDELSPRFGGFLESFWGRQGEADKEPIAQRKSNHKELCDAYGGTLVVKECLEFFPEPRTYEDARSECKKRNGDLYVPEKYEGFFFHKYFLYFRNAFHVDKGHSLGWVGAKREFPGQPILTVDNDDVTMDAIFNLRPVTMPQCFHILVDDHVLAGDDCTHKKPYTCEYKLSREPSIIKKKTSEPNKFVSFFTQFLPNQHRV